MFHLWAKFAFVSENFAQLKNVREFYSPILATMIEIRALRILYRQTSKCFVENACAEILESRFRKLLLIIRQGNIFNFSLHKFDVCLLNTEYISTWL